MAATKGCTSPKMAAAAYRESHREDCVIVAATAKVVFLNNLYRQLNLQRLIGNPSGQKFNLSISKSTVADTWRVGGGHPHACYIESPFSRQQNEAYHRLVSNNFCNVISKSDVIFQ